MKEVEYQCLPSTVSVEDDADEDSTRNDPQDEETVPLTKSTTISGHGHSKGLSVLSTVVFIVGEMAGSGVLALPHAIVDSGYAGLVLLVYFCFNAGCGGICLGNCWNVLEERYPEYREPVRNPYATIAYKAVGKKMSILVSGCIQITLFGAGTVYLLLASQIIQELLMNLVPDISFCIWFLIIACLICPFMWLQSPKNFRFVGVTATLTTVIACILIFAQMLNESLEERHPVQHKAPTVTTFFIAFGTILFSFGGASTFPTIQNDMVEKHKFPLSIKIAFAIILLLYLPVASGGYVFYGDKAAANIVLSLKMTFLVLTSNILMALHLVLAFLIVINPVCQEVEERLSLPRTSNWKQRALRTAMLGVMIFLGESVPSFGMILSLIGGSTITLLTFVFPSLFYMRLCDQKSEHWPVRHISVATRFYFWHLVFIGIIGGAASTYNATLQILVDPLSKPCYMQLTNSSF